MSSYGDPMGGGELAALARQRLAEVRAAQPAHWPAPPVPAPPAAGPPLEDVRDRAWADAIPPRHRLARVDGIRSPDVRDHVIDWATRDDATNLVLYGPTGTGKTYAATAAARERHEAGATIAYWRVPVLLRALRPDGEGDPRLLERLCRVGLLVLDDVGAHKGTDWADEQLDVIVGERWDHERPTVATTNLPPEDLGPVVGGRAWSRLLGDGALVLALGGHDRRLTGS